MAAANPGTAAAAGPRLIFKVDSAAATIRGDRLTIIASGAVSTGGWTKPRLRAKPGHKPETDTLEFDFLAAPPPGNETVIQALVPVTATITTHLPSYGITQIKLNAETNSTIVAITP
ncbi:MAG TPA: hypothetical protein VIJ85_12600 [Rhizomicrobium sp.]